MLWHLRRIAAHPRRDSARRERVLAEVLRTRDVPRVLLECRAHVLATWKHTRILAFLGTGEVLNQERLDRLTQKQRATRCLDDVGAGTVARGGGGGSGLFT